MKIAIVSFPINDAGGINSWCENIIKGFRRLNHQCQLIHATPQTRYECDPEEKITRRRYSVLPGIHLSYRDMNSTARIQEELNKYDFVLFLHPAPHPTNENLSKIGIQNWQYLYDIRPPKVMVFHDEKWDQTNDWIRCVKDKVEGVHAAQRRFFPAAQVYPSSCRKWWDYFPLDITDTNNIWSHENFGIVATQWIKWKNHHLFLPKMPDIHTPIHLFGSGIEYHNLMKQGVLQKAVYLNHDKSEKYNSEVPHQFHGFIEYEALLEWMKHARFSIDLSTRGYTNMTHWEPLIYGTTSFIERRVFNDPFNMIPGDCCYIYDMDTIVEDINSFSEEQRQALAESGREFIESTSRCEDVANRILNNVFD